MNFYALLAINFTHKLISLLVLTSGLLFSVGVFSQEYTITVNNANTELAIPDAIIKFTEIATQKSHFKVTNSQGEAPNNIKGLSSIHISYTGYKSVVDTIYSKTSKTYFLEKDIFLLDQVVVTSTRTKKALKNAPVLTQIITSKQMEARGFQNITDVLTTDIPGIEIQQHGYGANISAQGLEPENILILIDGERMAGETRSNIDYSRLNSQEVERIEIVKGAASALYGSQAMGAVINIITKKSKQKVYGSMSTQYTSLSEKNYPNLTSDNDNYSFKKNLDKANLTQNYTFGLNLGKWQSKTNYTQKAKDAYQLFDTDSIKQNFEAFDKVVYKPRNLEPTNILGIKDFTINQSIGFTPSKQFQIDAKASFYQHHQFDFFFDNIHDMYSDFSYSLKATYKPNQDSNYTLSWHDDTYKKFDYFEKLSENQINYSHRYINPKLIGSYQIFKKHLFTGGVEYLSESLLSDHFSGNELDTKNVSNGVIFLQDDIKISDKWNTIVGLRTDYHTSFGEHYSPKLSVMYKRYPFTIRTNFASGYRSPSLKELYTDWAIEGLWFIIKGNELLKPETNQYVATSFEYSKSKINTSVNVYYNAFKDKIEGIWLENQTIYQYQNTDNATLVGVDYLIHYQPLNALYIKGAYSYVYESRDEGIRIANNSPHTGSLQVGYAFQRKNYSLNASITGKYIGGKDFYDIDTFNYQGEQIEATYKVHYDAYDMWRLSLQQEFKNYLSITLGVDNLFDYTPKIITFNTSTTPGRSYFVGIKLDFEQLFNNN